MRKILLFCLAACSAPEPESTASVVFQNTVLSPELAPALEIARDRWVAASCLDIRLDGGGTEWSISPHEILTSDGKQAHGSMDTSITPGIGLIWVEAPDWERTATHEMGHRLGIEHVAALELMNERNMVNRQRGLRYDHISEASLSALCSAQDCPCFNPEPGPTYDATLLPMCPVTVWDPTTGYHSEQQPCP